MLEVLTGFGYMCVIFLVGLAFYSVGALDETWQRVVFGFMSGVFFGALCRSLWHSRGQSKEIQDMIAEKQRLDRLAAEQREIQTEESEQ